MATPCLSGGRGQVECNRSERDLCRPADPTPTIVLPQRRDATNRGRLSKDVMLRGREFHRRHAVTTKDLSYTAVLCNGIRSTDEPERVLSTPL
ncbi:hypothetical protein J6590_055321 [Homalodisca vitripennis]|nr:hypothetical protein J6590_055321 [Homalodisca vitripennis]